MTTYAAGFCSSRCFFVPPHRITEAGAIDEIALFHIYVIVRVPRVRMLPKSFTIGTSHDFCMIKVGNEFSNDIRELSFPKEYGISSVESADGAGRNFIIHHKGGETSGDFPLLVMKHNRNGEYRNHKVVYIGQAYGASGRRNVIDRLLKHEKLQKIVSENSIEAPDTDVYVYGFQYTENDQLLVMFDGTDKSLVSDHRDDERLKNVLDSPIDEKTMTQIVEAALIRYFKPVYNEKFKELFPNDTHRFLSGLKELDYEGFTVEIDTEDLHTRLRSDVVGLGGHHVINFRINEKIQKKSSFDFYELMDGTGIDPSSGPLF